MLVDTAQINVSCSPMNENVTRAFDIEGDTYFTRPVIDGANRKNAQGCLRSRQLLNHFVNGSITASSNHHLCLLLDRFARKSSSITSGFCQSQGNILAMLL